MLIMKNSTGRFRNKNNTEDNWLHYHTSAKCAYVYWIAELDRKYTRQSIAPNFLLSYFVTAMYSSGMTPYILPIETVPLWEVLTTTINPDLTKTDKNINRFEFDFI